MNRPPTAMHGPSTPIEPAARGADAPGTRPAAESRTLRLSAWSRVEVAAASAPAPHHAVNEDAHSLLAPPADDAGRVLVLADGVGGGALAAEVSRRLVEALQARLGRGPVDADAISRAVLDADRELRDFVAAHARAPGAATLALCVPAGRSAADWWIGWVGDCRVYALGTGRDEPARLLTRDDTYRQLGETPPPGGSPDDPARMVGNGAVRAPNTCRMRLAPGERLLLCSDGVHKHLTPHQIGEGLRGRGPLGGRCADLVAHARRAGSTDDATVLVVERRRRSWLLGLAAALVCAALLLLGGLALWNAYGLGGRATPPVFGTGDPERADPADAALPPVTEPALAEPPVPAVPSPAVPPAPPPAPEKPR